MKLRHFVVDQMGQLLKASQAGIKGLIQGRRSAGTLGYQAGHELRLVSIVCDAELLPMKIYIFRLPLTDGWFTEENALRLMPHCATMDGMVQHHTEGWPTDFFRQLAVALDVPLAGLQVPLGLGGPLFKHANRESSGATVR
jgi:hypothetical protein